MNNLKYYIITSIYILIDDEPHCSSRFEDVQWNDVMSIICTITFINKQVYNFILKLPKLQRFRIRDDYYHTYLITYNLKFFKHKSLRMGRNGHIATDSIMHIIFIL